MASAVEVIDEMVKPENVTFDTFMRRDPRTLTDAELRQMVEVDRADRALFIATKEKKAKDKEENDE